MAQNTLNSLFKLNQQQRSGLSARFGMQLDKALHCGKDVRTTQLKLESQGHEASCREGQQGHAWQVLPN